MPIKVNLPDGRVVHFPDSMTPEQVEAEVMKLTGPQMRSAPPDKPRPTEIAPDDPYGANLLTKAVGVGRSFLGGMGQGLASTVLHIDDLRRDVTEFLTGDKQERPLDNANVRAAITPYNLPSKVGFVAEQVGEAAVPAAAVASRVSKVQKVANAGRMAQAAAHAATQAPVAGVVATAQQGDVKAATMPAIIAGATPVAGAVVRGVAERTLYPAVRGAIAPGGILDDFFTNVGLRPPKQAVAGQTAANLDEALRQVREVGIRGNRGDWDRIAKWLQSRREQFAQARQQLQAAGKPTEPMRKAAQDLRAEEDMLHRLSEELAKHHPETGFSPFGTGGLGYLFGGPQAGVPLAIAEAVRKRFPAWSATQMDRAASLLGAPGTAGVMGGLTSTTLQDELMRRELEERR